MNTTSAWGETQRSTGLTCLVTVAKPWLDDHCWDEGFSEQSAWFVVVCQLLYWNDDLKVSEDNNVHPWNNKWERRVVTLAPRGELLHSGIGFSRSRRSSLCQGRVSFSILSPLSGGNFSPRHFHLTTIGVPDNCSVINSDCGAVCWIAVCLRCWWFSSTWAINGILGPYGFERRMMALIVSCVPSAAQPEPDGWSGRDMADWEASRTRADVAYTLVISREYSW